MFQLITKTKTNTFLNLKDICYFIFRDRKFIKMEEGKQLVKGIIESLNILTEESSQEIYCDKVEATNVVSKGIFIIVYLVIIYFIIFHLFHIS